KYSLPINSPLLLPSLRLFIPPLRLVSAAMWQVVQRGSVQDYGMVEEFISTVSEIVPELLNADQKAQLLLGLRARVRLQCLALVSTWPCFAEVEFPESDFVDQVELLMKDPEEKEKFFQDVFPTDFGPEYDSALQMLMLDFLSRLEKLLPIPDIQQVLEPSNEVIVFPTDDTQTIPSSLGNCILSSLSLPQLEKVEIEADQIELQPAPEQMEGCMTVPMEAETVTLLDYIQIEQPSGLIDPDDNGESEVDEEDAVGEECSNALKPAAFQPLKQSKRLQLKRKVSDEGDSTPKRQRKKYPNNKICPVCNKIFLRAAAMRRHLETHSATRDLKYKCDNSKDEESEDPSTSETLENKNCTLCGKYFARHVDMERHMKSHSDDRPYKCSFCEKKFKNPYVLKRHQKEICKSRELKKPKRMETPRSTPQPSSEGLTEGKVCPICSRILPYSADIAKHLRSHTEERPFICITCEKGFKYKDTLKKHQIIHTEESPSLPVKKGFKKGLKVCPVCARAFDSVKTLNRHIQCHTEDRPYHCIHCKKRFKHMHGLKRHQIYAICHKKIGQPLKIPAWCSNCGKHFEYPSALKEHQENVCKVEVSEVMKCDDCGKEFKSMTLLKVHQRIHDPLYCNECGKILANERLREHYEKKHTGEKPFLCWQCGKCYRSASELTVHMGTHSEERPWACTQCDMAYRTKLQLTNHVEQVHIGVRYPCSSCGKQFMKETSLKRHELIHTGERPHQCTVCGKTFLTANELRLHNRYHTGERPYKCEECGKAFIQSGYLKSHMRIHTGEKPFKCDICDKGFRLSYHMKKHRRTHSGNSKTYSCKECGMSFMVKKSLCEHSLTHNVKIEPAFIDDVRIEFQ
uniref:C2H2-type domain-containing protein n=1 Tax=Mola mola TaxID=94237 RepID=A0A3Q4AWB2_MOLML